MADHFDVAVVGSLHLDIMTKAPRLPALDETVLGQSWHFKCGGKGGNQAVAAARAGARTAFIGCVGNDDFGSRLLAHLDAAKVDRSRVSIDPKSGSGMSVAMEDTDGNYSAVVVSGANQNIRPAQYEGLSTRVLLIQNEISASATLDAARACKRGKAFVVYNTAPFLYIGVSAEFIYLGSSSGESARPPNAMIFPISLWMGNIRRLRKAS